MTTALEREITRGETAPELVARMRASFDSGRTRPLEYRLEQLAGIARFLKEREAEIEQAIHRDLGRPALEVYSSEIAFIASELALVRKKLASWMKPQRVPTSLVGQPGKSLIYREPLGVVLIIGPWNYPLQLVLVPLLGAIAAGNCAIVKPSEVAPATSELLAARLQRLCRSAMRPSRRWEASPKRPSSLPSGSTTSSTQATVRSGASSWKPPRKT